MISKYIYNLKSTVIKFKKYKYCMIPPGSTIQNHLYRGLIDFSSYIFSRLTALDPGAPRQDDNSIICAKKIKKYLALILLIPSLGLASQEVNVYNWANYMPPKVLKEFTKETGIKVNYALFDGNETLYTKLKINPTGYDVVFPSAYMVAKMRKEGMLHKIDKDKLSNFKYLNPLLLNKSYDPGSKYSLPYFWGTTGILINDQYYNPKSIKSWADLWQPKFKGQLLILDEAREAFAMSLKSLGYSINDNNPQHIKLAFEHLKSLLPNIKIFNEDASSGIYADDDATAGMVLNGDAYLASDYNQHLRYIYPSEGATIWTDNITIPKNAANLNNAYIFINFILRPDIAAQIANYVGYASPNLGAIKLLSASDSDNPMLYPPKNVIQNGEVETDINDKTTELMEHYWQLLKLS